MKLWQVLLPCALAAGLVVYRYFGNEQTIANYRSIANKAKLDGVVVPSRVSGGSSSHEPSNLLTESKSNKDRGVNDFMSLYPISPNETETRNSEYNYPSSKPSSSAQNLNFPSNKEGLLATSGETGSSSDTDSTVKICSSANASTLEEGDNGQMEEKDQTSTSEIASNSLNSTVNISMCNSTLFKEPEHLSDNSDEQSNSQAQHEEFVALQSPGIHFTTINDTIGMCVKGDASKSIPSDFTQSEYDYRFIGLHSIHLADLKFTTENIPNLSRLLQNYSASLTLLSMSNCDFHKDCHTTVSTISSNSYSALIDALFALPSLEVVCFSNTNLGIEILKKLESSKVGWKEFALKEIDIEKEMLPLLLNLNSVEILDLSQTKLPANCILEFISGNISKFQSLKRVKILNNGCEKFSFPAALIKQGIVVEFDYEQVPLTVDNWSNYFAMSSGISIDLSQDNILKEMKKILATELKYCRVTHLTVTNCTSSAALQLLFDFMSRLPALKYFSVDVRHCQFDAFEVLRINESVWQVNHFVLRMKGVQNPEALAIVFLKWFCNAKTIEIHYNCCFELSKFIHLAPLESVQHLKLETFFDFAGAPQFFNWIATFKNLQSLLVKFNRHQANFNSSNIDSLVALSALKLKRLDFHSSVPFLNQQEFIQLFSKFKSLNSLRLNLVKNPNLEMIANSLLDMKLLDAIEIDGLSDVEIQTFQAVLKKKQISARVIKQCQKKGSGVSSLDYIKSYFSSIIKKAMV